MKRVLVLLLMISLGLNAGLALRLRQAARTGPMPVRERPGMMMPAPGDSQAWHDRMERRMQRMADHLGLDAGQREALGAHRRRVESDIRGQALAVDAARSVLRAEAERQPPDPAAVAAALAAVGRAEASLDSLVAANLRLELELLTPEQQSQMLRMMPFERLGGRGVFGGARGHRSAGHQRPGHAGPGGGGGE